MDAAEILARLEVVEDRREIYDVLTRYLLAPSRATLSS